MTREEEQDYNSLWGDYTDLLETYRLLSAEHKILIAAYDKLQADMAQCSAIATDDISRRLADIVRWLREMEDRLHILEEIWIDERMNRLAPILEQQMKEEK